MISRSIAAWMGARAIGERKLEQKAIDEDFADAVEAELLGLLDEAKAKDLKYEIAECQCYLGIISWCRGENDVANCRFTSSIMMNHDIKNDILLYENTYWHAISLAEQARYEDAKTLLKAIESNPAIDLFPRKRSRHFKVASHIAQTSLDWRSALEHYKAYHLACIAEQNRLLTARTQTMKIALDLEALKHQLGHQLVEHERVLEENLRLAASHREADRASRTDPLTGLGNRRELEIQCTDWKAAGIKSVALLLIDADHFKTVNDRFGHAIGDAALLKLADLFSAAIPAGGLATRIGGEEFLLALPELPFPDAKEFAHTILQSVSSCAWQNIHGDLRLTCSIGLSIWNVDVPLESAIATADAYLYEAKRGGRNRCVHA
jgi:diguanylate cyclase (GGDEF)-like protein